MQNNNAGPAITVENVYSLCETTLLTCWLTFFVKWGLCREFPEYNEIGGQKVHKDGSEGALIFLKNASSIKYLFKSLVGEFLLAVLFIFLIYEEATFPSRPNQFCTKWDNWALDGKVCLGCHRMCSSKLTYNIYSFGSHLASLQSLFSQLLSRASW